MEIVRTALWRGCLGGIGMALLFLLISAITYVALNDSGLTYNLVLLLTIASGPVIGTCGVLGVLYLRATRAQTSKPSGRDETTQGNTP